MRIEIKKTENEWKYMVHHEGNLLVRGNNFKTAKEALEAGSKRLLELLPKETFDFGQGPVPAHKHKNGGGWIADTAHVDDTVFVGPEAKVYEYAQVLNNAQILNEARVYGNANVKENTIIRDHAEVYGDACVFGNAEVAEFAHILGNSCLYGNVKICGCIRFCDASFYGEN